MWWLVCLLCAALTCAHAAVLRYNMQQVLVQDVAKLPEDHWAKYNVHAFDQGIPSVVSNYDDAPYFEPINISSPFFSYDSVPWHVSSDGFLAPTPSPMCQYFCTEMALDTLFGYYRFGGWIYDGGGDWPMIGLYVRDLNPGRASVPSSVRVYGVPRDAEAGGSGYDRVIVEYRDVPLTDARRGVDTLTAQVEVWANGTIVMRYRQVPNFGGASVGLVLSKLERILVSGEQPLSALAAIRYDPVMDSCPRSTTQMACNAAGNNCGWCAATSQCVHAVISGSTCPRGGSQTQERSLSEYYQIRVYQNVPLLDMESLENHMQWNATRQWISLDLGFDFPFFTRNQSSHTTSRMYLFSSGVISVLSETQNCRPIWNMCPNGNYTFSIIPFATTSTWGAQTTITYAQIPMRSNGGVLCDESECPPGFVVLVREAITRATTRRAYTYQVYMDRDGVVEFRYGLPVLADIATGSTLSFFAFPPPFIGLFRHRVEDPATITVPLPLIRHGTRVRFEPRGICNDCGLHGVCDPVTRVCLCGTGFTGDFCDQCLPGHYGPRCAPCRHCQNGGSCDDGVNGTGTCNCPAPFSGESCMRRCTEPYDCSKCNLQGGYCECGRCVCNARLGWGGPHCDIFTDPCRPHSLDGCNYCSNDTFNQCGFCFNRICYSGLLRGTPNEYTCSYTVPPSHSAVCTFAPQPVGASFVLGYLTMGLLFLAAVLFVTAVLLFAHLTVRGRSVYDIHRVAPPGGAPNHRAIRREREVVQAVFIQPHDPNAKQRHLLGVPLKQVPLQKLYESALENQSRRKEE